NLGSTTIDSTPPVITCPANRTVPSDAGSGCTASASSVSTGTATATDNCTATANIVITASRSDAQPLTAPYPVGMTTVTWRAADASDFSVSGSNYVANFIDSSAGHGPADVGNDALLSGNQNNDAFVDILDFGAFIGQFNVNYGSPNTTCTTTGPHTDFNGDGVVDIIDYTFINSNFLRFREIDPCGNGLAELPVTDISVFDLARTDYEAARRAD